MASGKRDPEPGDLIEIKRGVYQHWALYLGDGYVIHVTAEDEGIPPLSAGSVTILTRKAKVKKQLLKDVVGTDDWEVNNKYDHSHTPLPVNKIIKRAENYIDTERTYRLFYSNCEHFVTMLRYGEEISEQGKRGRFFSSEVVNNVAASVGAVALTASGVGPVTAAGVMIGAATVGCVAGAVANLRSSGRHSGNKRKNN